MKIKAENFAIFAVSLLMAVVLYLQVNSRYEPNKIREFEVTLDIRELPTGLMIVGRPDRVRVVAEGSTEQLERLDTSAVIAFVDLSNAASGSHTYAVELVVPATSASVALVNARERIDLEEIGELEIRVEYEPSGTPPIAIVTDGTATITPDTVTVFGPRSALGQVHRARVLFDQSRIRAGGTYTLPVEVLDANDRSVANMRTNPEQVIVAPSTAAAATSRRLVVQPSWEGSPAFGYRVVDHTIVPNQFEVTGENSVLIELSSLETVPINLDGLTETQTFEVEVQVPTGIALKQPRRVQVTVRIEPDPRVAPATPIPPNDETE